jgi:hypothetical protein
MPKTVTLPGEKFGTNVSITREGSIISLHIDTAAEPVTSKKDKRLVATTHGFARIHGVNVSVNVIPIGG